MRKKAHLPRMKWKWQHLRRALQHLHAPKKKVLELRSKKGKETYIDYFFELEEDQWVIFELDPDLLFRHCFHYTHIVYRFT